MIKNLKLYRGTCLLLESYVYLIFVLMPQMIDESTTFIVRKPIDDFQHIQITSMTHSIVASGVKLKSLKGLPDHIINLDVSDNELTDLKFCPKKTKNLRASKNKIKSLADIKDLEIENLGISYNHLQDFKGAPQTLRSVVAVSNFISSLDGLPKIMTKLYVSYNKLQNMIHCPAAQILDCSCNSVEGFRGIPNGVLELIISNNPLKYNLRDCPVSVEILRCSQCGITDLSGYPRALKLIECLKNNIKNDANIANNVKEVFIDQTF